MAKIIRLNEQDIENLVKRIIKEVGSEKFSDTKEIDSNGGILQPAIAKLKGEDHIVVIDNNDKIIGYGPKTKGLTKSRVCDIARRLISDWEDEVSMNEVDGIDFNNIRPITFCSKGNS